MLNKKKLADEFNVNARTIQRDFEDIRNYLADQFNNTEIIYDHYFKGYILVNQNSNLISAVEVFAIIKILIESRAFCKQEIQGLICSISILLSKTDKVKVDALVENELFHFQELTHEKPLLKMLWDIGQCIIKQEIIQIKFAKSNGVLSSRVIYPLSIVFSEYYFYLIAHIENSPYDAPAFFRIDRISSFKLLNKKFSYGRFEDGELKKKILFMYGGNLIHLKFMYSGQSIEVVKDRFPSAKIINHDVDKYLVNAELYGKGCLMWLLSQGSSIEIIEPAELREEFLNQLKLINQIYIDKEN